MFVPGLPLLEILGRYILLGLIGSIEAKKSGFSELGLGCLFLVEPFLRFGESDNWFARKIFLTI